jgi:ABC-type amino acid transport substrate-binding protein
MTERANMPGSRPLRWPRALTLALLLAVAAAPLALAAAPAQVVVYSRPSMDIDREASYPVELLELSLAKSGQAFTLRPSAEVIPQARSVLLLQSNSVIDVLWTVTSPERERQLLPVRIPIDRGIYGWRMFLIREDAQAHFDAVRNLADLATLRAGQGHDWPDLTILRSAGLEVDAGSSYDGLFEMLALGRIDYFPRALPELWIELEQRRRLPLAVENALALHYPSAMYFFVSRDNPQLAAALERGLEQAIDDGSFKTLFDRYFGDAIARAKLSQRRVFEIDNPLLPTLTTDPRYWFSPAAE